LITKFSLTYLARWCRQRDLDCKLNLLFAFFLISSYVQWLILILFVNVTRLYWEGNTYCIFWKFKLPFLHWMCLQRSSVLRLSLNVVTNLLKLFEWLKHLLNSLRVCLPYSQLLITRWTWLIHRFNLPRINFAGHCPYV
jgi:hypothetical protein